MFWLIENKQQYEELSSSILNKVFVEVIPQHYKKHPAENNICSIYIKPIYYNNKGYILTVDHPDAFNFCIEDIEKLLSKIETIYVRDKKEFLHYFTLPNIIDLSLDKRYDIPLTTSHEYFHNKIQNHDNINSIIPLVKHHELCEKIYDDLKNNINKPINTFYNGLASIVFYGIEKSGIHINPTKFSDRFYETSQDYVYTQYNFKTTTTRPSNSFNNVNYAALNKSNGDRECFIPYNNKLIEIDISAYHPTLLSKVIKYVPEHDTIYDDIVNYVGVERSKAKEIIIKQMYGGVWEEYEHLEFFKKLKKYMDSKWLEFNEKGYIKCDISNHVFYKKDLKDMNPPKLLNYILQNLETSYNILLLRDIIKILLNKNTKIVLYTYDSILLDFDENESEELEKIKKVFTSSGLKISTSSGKNYDFK